MTNDTLAERDPSIVRRDVMVHERMKPVLPEFFDGHFEQQTVLETAAGENHIF